MDDVDKFWRFRNLDFIMKYSKGGRRRSNWSYIIYGDGNGGNCNIT